MPESGHTIDQLAGSEWILASDMKSFPITNWQFVSVGPRALVSTEELVRANHEPG
jgi:hypothetical protein